MLNKFEPITLLNAVSKAIAIINSNGELIEYNDEFHRLLPNLEKSQSIVDIFTSSDVKDYLSQSLRDASKSFSLEHKNGESILLQFKFKLLKHEKDNFYVITVQEVPFLEENTYLQQLIDNIPDNIFIKDSEGRFILVNTWMLKTMGVDSREDLIGKNDKDFMSSDLANKYANNEKEIIKTGEPLINNLEVIIIEGETKWYSTTKVPLYDNGKAIGVMGIGRDISHFIDEKKQLQEAWEEASKADRLKSAFLANLSHEIRTPLNGILGFSQFLSQKQPPLEKQHKYLDIIHNNGKQLLLLLNDIIDVSMIESNQISINKQSCRMNGLLLQLQSNFKHQIKTNKLPIKLKINPGLSDKDDFLYTDDYRIHQVLSNLIGNAIKFTKSGTIEIGYKKKADFIEFFVKDTGIGISEETQSLIFKRFRQADDSITRKYGGAGLGLSICKGLIEKLGGNIKVKSKPGKGSTFYFTIPHKTNTGKETK